jgi:hypothetical protein
MKAVLIVIFFALLGQSVDVYRNAYKTQNEDKILACLDFLEDKKSKTELEQCYYAVFLCLKADYSSNPYTKYKSFNKGYALLQSLIAKDNSNVEYRYHRYMIEKNAPSFVLSERHLEADKTFIQQNLKKTHPLYDIIIKTVY